MKTKRFAKIAILVLTAVLLIGVVLGVSVSAETTGATEVSIAGKNISYEGALKVVFYVEAEGFDSETQKLSVNFWIGEKDDDTPHYSKEFTGESEYLYQLNGKTYYCFFSDGIAPADMTRPIVAQPVLTNEDETTVVGEAVSYSVYTYAMNRFSQEPTEDQLALYKALLDYGAAVQEVFGDANVADYGWADAYYDVTTNVYIDGEYSSDYSSSTNGIRALELDNINEDGEYVVALANSALGTAMYKALTDTDGNACSPYALPGTHSYNLHYTEKGTMNDFEGLTDVNVLFEGGSHTRWAEANLYDTTLEVDGINRTDTTMYMAFEQGTGKDGSESNYIVTGTVSGKGGGWKIDLNDGNNVAPQIGAKYIVDFDFKIASLDNSSGTYDRMVYLGLNSATANYTGADGNSSKNIASFDIYATADNVVNMDNDSNLALNIGEWYDIRIEYDIVSVDKASTEENEASAIVKIYFNGELVKTKTSTKVATLEAFYIEMRSKTSGQEYHIDNLYSVTFPYENAKGNGIYYNGIASTDTSVVYDFDDITSLESASETGIVKKQGGYMTLNNTAAKNYLAVVDGELVAGTNGNYASTWGWFALNGPDNSANDGEVGTKYVLEMDFKFAGGTGRDGSGDTNADNRLAYSFGMNSSENPTNSATSFLDYVLYDSGDGRLNFNKTPDFSLNKGRWYNILIEYEILANGFMVDASSSYDGLVKVYIDGSLVITKELDGTRVNTLFDNFYFEHNGTDAGYVFDNIYMGIDNNEGTKGTGVYYNKYLSGEITGATVYDFTDDTTIEKGDEFLNDGLIFNDYKHFPISSSDTAGYSSRYALVTGSGSMLTGSDICWGEAYVNGGSIPVAEGEVAVVEFDYIFLGAQTFTAGSLAELKIKNASNSAVLTLDLTQAGTKNGTSFTVSGVESSTFTGVAGQWYNFRIEITYSASGSSIDVYIDNVLVRENVSTTVDISGGFNLYYTTRVNGGNYQQHMFDNIVFDNISVNPASEATE